MNDNERLAELDNIVAKNDASDEPFARWRAADAVYRKARIIERRHGGESSLATYAEVVRRLEGSRDPGPHELLISALNDIANIHDDLGQLAESRAVAEALVDDHFADPPEGAIDNVVSASLLLATLVDDAGDRQKAIELLERLLERYGQPEVSQRFVPIAIANRNLGWMLGSSGRLKESITRYGRAIDLLRDCRDSRAARKLADSMARQAYYMYEANRSEEAGARCRELLDRFGTAQDPEIADSVAWAREMQNHEERYGPKRSRRWRGFR